MEAEPLARPGDPYVAKLEEAVKHLGLENLRLATMVEMADRILIEQAKAQAELEGSDDEPVGAGSVVIAEPG